jgi:hypothetical protein
MRTKCCKNYRSIDPKIRWTRRFVARGHEINRDITNQLKRVNERLLSAERGQLSNGDRTRKCFKTLNESVLGVSIDWDEEAGEEWARLLYGDSVLVAMRADAPIAFVCGTDDISKRLGDDLVSDGWEVIRSTSWDEPEFRLDGPTATALFPHWFFFRPPAAEWQLGSGQFLRI